MAFGIDNWHQLVSSSSQVGIQLLHLWEEIDSVPADGWNIYIYRLCTSVVCNCTFFVPVSLYLLMYLFYGHGPVVTSVFGRYLLNISFIWMTACALARTSMCKHASHAERERGREREKELKIDRYKE